MTRFFRFYRISRFLKFSKINFFRYKKMSRSERNAVELPRFIKDSEQGVQYEKGRFLGKGGFAKCYEFTNQTNKILYAGKVVPKTLLQKSHQKVS